MNIYDYLKRDHQMVSRLMKKVINESRQNERVKLLLKIKSELELHTDPERNTFYKAIQSHKEHAELIEEGISEHEFIKSLFKKIDKAKSKDQWLIHFGELKSMVDHHVQQEENTIFELGKEILSESQAEELAVEMDKLKNSKMESKNFMKQFKEREETKPKSGKGRKRNKKSSA